tara:strand:- start:40 stop:315 length:276 start_codon:yes stop_codon:yes gene_type:complete
MAHKTDLEKIADLTFNDCFFILLERLDLVNHYYLDPVETKTYYDRLIIINKEKPSLDEMKQELIKYKVELINLEGTKLKLYQKEREVKDES